MMQSCGGAMMLSEMSATCVAILLSCSKPDPFHCFRRMKLIKFVSRLRFALGLHRIIHLHAGAVPDGLQHLVAAGDDLIALFQSALDLDIRCPRQAGLYRAELAFLAAGNDEDAL